MMEKGEAELIRELPFKGLPLSRCGCTLGQTEASWAIRRYRGPEGGIANIGIKKKKRKKMQLSLRQVFIEYGATVICTSLHDAIHFTCIYSCCYAFFE